MRIAIFHNLPPGGGRRALFELVRRTTAHHEYDLFRIDLGAAERWPEFTRHQDLREVVRNTHDYQLRGLRPPIGLAVRLLDVERVVRLQRRIAADIDAGGYDLVLLSHEQFQQSPAVLEWLHTPSVYYCQEPRRRSFEYSLRSAPGPRPLQAAVVPYDRLMARRDVRWARAATRLLCNSVYSAETILRCYGRDATVCYLGVDQQVFRPTGTRERRHAVCSVGSLEPSKGHDCVVEALGRVPKAQRPALDVAYERCHPPFREALVRLADARGVRLTLHHALTDADLATLYASARLTVCAARLEPFGLTVIESQSCGTPVVAIREAGLRESVTEGVNGTLVERDPAALAAGISEAVARAPDAAAIRASVEPFWSWEAAARRFQDQIEGMTVAGMSHQGRSSPVAQP